jgi:hypothetical protein
MRRIPTGSLFPRATGPVMRRDSRRLQALAGKDPVTVGFMHVGTVLIQVGDQLLQASAIQMPRRPSSCKQRATSCRWLSLSSGRSSGRFDQRPSR